MIEFTKSMLSYSLAVSLFGVQQAASLLASSERGADSRHPATKAFDEATHGTVDQFDGMLRSTFHAIDNVQRGLVSLAWGVMMPWTVARSNRHPSAAAERPSSEPTRIVEIKTGTDY